MDTIKITALVIVLVMMLSIPLAIAQDAAEDMEGEEFEILGVAGEELLAFIGGHVAAALAILTFIAYSRTKRSKLLYIVAAFALFSIRLFIESSELFIGEIANLDSITAILDFVILLAFFVGVIKK